MNIQTKNYIIINKKKYYFYEIIWFDILGDSGHVNYEEFKKMTPVKIITKSYIFNKDKNYLKTFASYSINEESFSDVNIIPIGCVVNIKKINIK